MKICCKCGKRKFFMKRSVAGTYECKDCSGRSRYTGVEKDGDK